MPSAAFVEWSTVRQHRLDNLVAAHRAVTGGGPGRKTLTEEINHALIVRLASEFQGYCRDLHDEAIEALVSVRVSNDPVIISLIESLAVLGRKLDSGNATWSTITSDFGRLGINVAVRLRARYPARYSSWVNKIELLHRARNAIAHSNRDQLASVASLQALDLGAFRSWRAALAGVASGLDIVIKTYLRDLNGLDPW